MDRWNNKIAVVTGASSGVGNAIIKHLVKAKLIVIALDNEIEKIDEIRQNLSEDLQSNLHSVKCNISNEDEVVKAFNCILRELGDISILINNAKYATPGNLVHLSQQHVRETIDTNLLGTVLCTRQIFDNLQQRNAEGHIILMNSIFGHVIPNVNDDMPSFNIYGATKYATTALAEIYRQECIHLRTKIKITSISPGLLDYEMPSEEIAKLGTLPILKAEDVADSIIFVLGTPAHVQISELTIQPLGERY